MAELAQTTQLAPVEVGPDLGVPEQMTAHRTGGLWRKFLASTRLSLASVCQESAPLGEYDYHTYADDVNRAPWDVEGGRLCRRCGKHYRT